MKLGIKTHDQINQLVDDDSSFKLDYSTHVTILAKNEVGFKNLFKIMGNLVFAVVIYRPIEKGYLLGVAVSMVRFLKQP